MCNRCSVAHRCAAEAILVCHEIFTSHYNYKHNAIKRYKYFNSFQIMNFSKINDIIIKMDNYEH
jgi:hypothetical protein